MRGNLGFTLLETVVVLVITSLISVVLVQGFGLILAARTSVEDKITGADRAIIERNLILEPLRGLLPDYPDRPNMFAGESRKLHGLTVHPLQDALGAPVGFTMSLEYNPSTRRTDVVYQEVDMDAQTIASWEGDTGAFAYRDRTGDWRDSWPPPPTEKPQQTPWLIKVDMGTGFPESLVASINGAHQRFSRMQDTALYSGPPPQ